MLRIFHISSAIICMQVQGKDVQASNISLILELK